MKLRKSTLLLSIICLIFSVISIKFDNVFAKGIFIPDNQSDPLVVGDFFLTEDELPAGWILDPSVYTPNAHMLVKEKLMGGDWWSVRIRDSEMSKALHVTIGLFATEAEAIKFSDPDVYIFGTDAYNETGQTINEMIQTTNPGYSVTGGTVYGDGGFSGGYQHQEFQPFNVFRVGSVLIHTDASDPSGEGVLEQLLVDKARRLQSLAEPVVDEPPADTGSDSQLPPTVTPTVGGPPIVLKASLDGKGEATRSLPNNDNYGVIMIDGKVTDQDGKGVGGANVEVVSGADFAAITTNPDGTYSIVVSVPEGMGNGIYQEVNFTLALIDLSIHEIVLLQAISGGQMVQGRDIGMRIFLKWTGKSPAEIEAIATVDGVAQLPVHGQVKAEYTQKDKNLGKDSINLVLPHELFPFDASSSHSMVVTVKLVDQSIQEVDLDNNTSVPQTFTLQRTDSPSLLYVSMASSIGRNELVRFSGQANHFIEQVYPIPFAWAMVGTARVSYYIVDPNTEFLKSQSTDNLPNWVPEFIKEAAEYPLRL